MDDVVAKTFLPCGHLGEFEVQHFFNIINLII